MDNTYIKHPWHGVNIGDNFPNCITAYIEIVPTDTVKYELDKISGLLKIDRPQLYSNYCPSLYGFIPQTYCGNSVAEFCRNDSGKTVIKGDGDPLDICVLTEKNISHGNIIVQAIPIGGIRMIDNGEADDKIIAVLKDDLLFGKLNDMNECPQNLIDRLKHYFLTYKLSPNSPEKKVDLDCVYSRDKAFEVIKRSIDDYKKLVSQN